MRKKKIRTAAIEHRGPEPVITYDNEHSVWRVLVPVPEACIICHRASIHEYFCVDDVGDEISGRGGFFCSIRHAELYVKACAERERIAANMK